VVRRGAIVDQYDAAGLHFRGRSPSNCLLQAEIVGDLRVVLALQGSPSRGDAAAMGADDQALRRELLQVTPYRKRGNLQHPRKVIHPQLGLQGPEKRDYLRLSAALLHGF
jgi:hypothetical protein